MEPPNPGVAPGQYMVTGDREVMAVLTVHPKDGKGKQRWELSDGATLYDVTHLRCRSARYTPESANAACTPASVAQKGFPRHSRCRDAARQRLQEGRPRRSVHCWRGRIAPLKSISQMSNPSSPADHFNATAARAYDARNRNLSPIADCMHFLIRLALQDLPAKSHALCVGVGTGAEILSLAKVFPQWTLWASTLLPPC